MGGQGLLEKWNNRALFRLIWPLLVEQMLAVAMGTVDTIMVSSVGEAAVSGVSLVDSINILLINMFYALAVGGAVVVSQYIGRRDGKNASLAAKQLVYTVTALALVLMVLALVLRRGILHLLYGHIAPDVMANAEVYLLFSAVSYPFIGLQNGLSALFRSMGNSKVGMLIAALVNVVNIFGNMLFIYGFGWGVGGAALSTLISRVAAAVVLFALILKRNTGIVQLAGVFRVRVDVPMVKRILAVGVPSGVENSMFQIGKVLVARVVSTFGTAAIAGNAIANLVASYATLPGSAFSMALLTVVGQFVGARDYPGAVKITKKVLKAAYMFIFPLNMFVLLISGPMLRMFNLSAGGIAVAQQCLLIYCLTMPLFWVTSFALPNALRAAGDARFNMVVSLLCMWLCRVALSYPLAYTFGLGVVGVWVAMVVDWVARSACFVVRWRHGKWKTKHLID